MSKPVQKFLDSGMRNSWLSLPHMQVYVRRGHHLIDRRPKSVFDIANVTVAEGMRGRGVFTEFLNDLFVILPGQVEGIFVESILNERFFKYLIKRGFGKDEREGLNSVNAYFLFPKPIIP
jgi:hypothetical protein